MGAKRSSQHHSFAVTYDVWVDFTHQAFHPDNPSLALAVSRKEPGRRHRVGVVIDDGVANSHTNILNDIQAYMARYDRVMQLAAPPRLCVGGEQAKNNPAILTDLQRWIVDLHLDRQSFVIAIGGGAVLDVVGFAAATVHRGVRLVRMPTTVLSQADSGVGMKNGVNAFGQKNLLGSFCPPNAVIADTSFLATLSARDKRAGMAEAVKVGLIQDRRFFEWLEQNQAALQRGDQPVLVPLVRRSAAVHLQHILTSGDPFELGNVRPLDHGHWLAHKLESLTDHTLRHGEAVAIGIAVDALYSLRVGILGHHSCQRVLKLLRGLGFELFHPALAMRAENGARLVQLGLEEFREHLGGELALTMATAIGESTEVRGLLPDVLEEVLVELESRYGMASPARSSTLTEGQAATA